MKTEQENHITVQFHCHTNCSQDSSNGIADLISTARERGLDKLAITDHNSIQGALKAKTLAPDLIIVGEEILTEGGELIAYFVKEEIPRRLSVKETLRRLKDQGAFISIPHPFDWSRHGWPKGELLELLPKVDAIEVFNSRCMRKKFNDQALAFARDYGVPMLAGSDAHSIVELGLAVTRLPSFSNAQEMRAAVRDVHISGSVLSVGDHIKASVKIALSKINLGRK